MFVVLGPSSTLLPRVPVLDEASQASNYATRPGDREGESSSGPGAELRCGPEVADPCGAARGSIVRRGPGQDPARRGSSSGGVNHPAFLALDEAFKEGTGREAERVRAGGSIPIVPQLGAMGSPVVLTGIGLPDDGLHSPNEKLDLQQLWDGIGIFASFMEKLAQRGT